MLDLNFHNFEEAGKQVLKYLHEQYGFGLWMITRVEGDKWIILQSENEKYNLPAGTVFHWEDSFCYHMVQGKAPKIAPCTKEVLMYANAKINEQLNINAYIGEPLLNEDGSVFGTICAVDTEGHSEDIYKLSPLIELFGRLLSSILQGELRENTQRRLKERFEVEAMTDVLTGLFNRRAWNQLLVAEEDRCQRYGLAATIFSIDLNNLKVTNDQYGHEQGDLLIQKTAYLLLDRMRSNDVVARIGGDEFVILCPETTWADAVVLFTQLQELFAEAQIHVAIGYASRKLDGNLNQTFIQADQNMYEQKRQMKIKF